MGWVDPWCCLQLSSRAIREEPCRFLRLVRPRVSSCSCRGGETAAGCADPPGLAPAPVLSGGVYPRILTGIDSALGTTRGLLPSDPPRPSTGMGGSSNDVGVISTGGLFRAAGVSGKTACAAAGSCLTKPGGCSLPAALPRHHPARRQPWANRTLLGSGHRALPRPKEAQVPLPAAHAGAAGRLGVWRWAPVQAATPRGHRPGRAGPVPQAAPPQGCLEKLPLSASGLEGKALLRPQQLGLSNPTALAASQLVLAREVSGCRQNGSEDGQPPPHLTRPGASASAPVSEAASIGVAAPELAREGRRKSGRGRIAGLIALHTSAPCSSPRPNRRPP